MNCANHTERTATGFCQNCGKALCPECTRTADGLILCQPCLELRHPAAAGWGPVPQTPPYTGRQTGYAPVPGGYAPQPGGYVPPPGSPSPFLAGLLGFIPGVGAMYNGQFIKGLIHVVVFVVLIGVTQHFPLGGLLIAAWEFYQVFDAAHTASARRDGRPLPDPLGLLDLSQRLGPADAGYAPPPPPPAAGHAPPPPGYAPPAPGPAAAPPAPGAQWTPVPQADPNAWRADRRRRGGEPVGALILIALGVLALLSTLDVFNFDWIGRGWPLILLGIGVWLLIRRSTAAPRYPAPPAPGHPPAPPVPGNSLSITPYREPGTTAAPEHPATGVQEEPR